MENVRNRPHIDPVNTEYFLCRQPYFGFQSFL